MELQVNHVLCLYSLALLQLEQAEEVEGKAGGGGARAGGSGVGGGALVN